MPATSPSQQEQTKLWNGRGGAAWVEAQETLDQMLRPYEELLLDAVASATEAASATPASASSSGTRVLDVGCGTGTTTFSVARLLGSNGWCTGVDISEPMIAAARSRAEQLSGVSDAAGVDLQARAVNFIQADAQTYAFEPATFDMIISRFGVMFFDDPVQAFATLRAAAKDDAELRFVAWRSAAENPFMTTAERAAAPFLPDLPPRRANVPGQFAFADQQRIHTILQESGWSDIDISPVDVACSLPAADLFDYVTRLGPVGMILQDKDEHTRARVIEAMRAAFDRYVHGDEVRFTGACWWVGARQTERAKR